MKGLRARGADAATVFEEQMTGRSDEEQPEYASERNRTLYTFNVGDFCRLHKEYLEECGNSIFRTSRSPSGMG